MEGFILKMEEAKKYIKGKYTNCEENNKKLIYETMEKYELSYITVKAILDDLKRKRRKEEKKKRKNIFLNIRVEKEKVLYLCLGGKYEYRNR